MSEGNTNETGAAIKLRLPAAFKAEVEEAAESMHISVSALTRIALAEYIKEHAKASGTAA
jgi:antitoxin component of RelBE/YafQ-DinJ toxin-antitoxin module